MEEIQVCSSWEEIEENSNVNILDKQLEKLKLEKGQSEDGLSKIKILTRKSDSQRLDDLFANLPRRPDMNTNTKDSSLPIMLDSTREESLRSQYVPPEPRITLLARPKATNTQNTNGQSSKSKSQQPKKSLEQREKEYMEARKRILGDVQFEDAEDDVEGELSSGGSSARDSDGSNLSPAEILKQKIAQAMQLENSSEAVGSTEEAKADSSGSGSGAVKEPGTSKSKSKSRGKRNREKLKTTNPESPRDFPLSKSESERILRQPRGPDGTTGFVLQR